MKDLLLHCGSDVTATKSEQNYFELQGQIQGHKVIDLGII